MFPSTRLLLLLAPPRNARARACARRIFENTARAFLIERLTGSPLLIADADSLKNFAVRFGRKFQSHREHNIIGRKRCMPVFEIYFRAPQGLDPSGRRPEDAYLADMRSDLRPVRPGVHAQRPADGSWNADQSFHAAQVVLGARRDGPAEIDGAIRPYRVPFETNIRILT